MSITMFAHLSFKVMLGLNVTGLIAVIFFFFRSQFSVLFHDQLCSPLSTLRTFPYILNRGPRWIFKLSARL